MANPRQRRKQKSGSHKVVSSRRQKDKLRKVDPRGPPPLVAAWDKTKTPRQNWEALGLLSGKLQPRLVGGVEKKLSVEDTWVAKQRRPDEFELEAAEGADDDAVMVGAEAEADGAEGASDTSGEDDGEPVAGSSAPVDRSADLGANEGRIVRDPATGRIVQIILGGGEVAEPTPSDDRVAKSKGKDWGAEEATPWGKPLEDVKVELTDVATGKFRSQGIAYSAPAGRAPKPKTPVVAELERLASAPTPTAASRRFTSTAEGEWLAALVKKHGADVDAMAKDRKGNVMQRTAGEIRRAIQKAGGLDAVSCRSTPAS